MEHYSGVCPCRFCTDYAIKIERYKSSFRKRKRHPPDCSCDGCHNINFLRQESQKAFYKKTIFVELEAVSKVFNYDSDKISDYLWNLDDLQILKTLCETKSIKENLEQILS